MKTINKILLGIGAVGALTLDALNPSVDTFQEKLNSIKQDGDRFVYNFSNNEKVSGAFDMTTGNTYEVTQKDYVLLPSTISYKKIN